ncbi:MAG: metallophosphoesterase [Lactobacillus sp.]|jgi:3',5'-cyclic AMP phosphodiesterase CpdA|nr:metallophosphoesterase [Lactobacillus sp.]MCI1973456.1 metallophosphoesterase [Lactobacillus sp.]
MDKQNITTSREPVLWILSDTHLLARNLHDYGPAFRRMELTTAGKDLAYQEWRLQGLVDLAITKRPTAIIITGDLTFNGEYESARRLADIFAALEVLGIPLLVVPGNHDINDGWARSFHGQQMEFAREISLSDWKNLFFASYMHATSQDPSSLAYSVNLNDQYRLLLLDSCLYQPFFNYDDPVTNGAISQAELQWVKSQLAEAKAAGQRCLVFMHHDLYRHNRLIHRGFVLDNADEVERLLAEYQVTAVFAGHIHAQNILPANDQRKLPEIVTSAFCMTDQGYGVVQLSPTGLIYQRRSFARPEQEFAAYLHSIFFKRDQRPILQKLAGREIDPQLWQACTHLLAKMHWAYFTGSNLISEKDLTALQQTPAFNWLVQEQIMRPDYLLSLYHTDPAADNWQLELKY